jgi:phosphohistidine phosphatase
MTPAGHRRLILTRHAKSAWDDPLLADRDRPLNKRGSAAATELGLWLASRDYLPDQVLCSDAVRTRETWDRVAAGLPSAPAPVMKPALYHAAPDVMHRILTGATGTCVMMLGHNPGIAEFAARLVAEPPHHTEFTRYPTTATLVVDFQIDDWTDLQSYQGSALEFFVPGDNA